MGDFSWTVALPDMPQSVIRDDGDSIPSKSSAADAVVSCDVASHQSEEWHQCDGAPTYPGAGRVSNGMDDAPETSSCNGSARSGSS